MATPHPGRVDSSFESGPILKERTFVNALSLEDFTLAQTLNAEELLAYASRQSLNVGLLVEAIVARSQRENGAQSAS